MNNLPVELYSEIFTFLYFIDINKLKQLNKFFYQVVQNYRNYLFAKIYITICNNVKENIIKKLYLLGNCNVTYPAINKKLKNKKSICFLGINELTDGIYYYSQNIWPRNLSNHPYILDNIDFLTYNKYLVIMKREGNIDITCFKSQFNNGFVEEKQSDLDLKLFSTLFRLF